MKQFQENRRYALIVGIVILITACTIIGLNLFSIRILSTIRAFANVESEYSKGQKDATRYLLSYLDSGDGLYFRKFQNEIAVPLGDRNARFGLQNGHTNAMIREGFLQGRN